MLPPSSILTAAASNRMATRRPTVRSQPNPCLQLRRWPRCFLMIEIVLAHSDLARVRFAHSPIEELVASLRVLQDPSRQLMYGRWLAATRPRLDGGRLEFLPALRPARPHPPFF